MESKSTLLTGSQVKEMKMHWVWIWVTWYKKYTFQTTQLGTPILISFSIPVKEGQKVPVNDDVCHWRWLKEGGGRKYGRVRNSNMCTILLSSRWT